MTAFTPSSWAATGFVALIWISVLWIGLVLFRRGRSQRLRRLAWPVAVISVLATERLCHDEPAGVRMVAIILVLFYAMKNIVLVESEISLPPRRWLCFMLWPGMKPSLFARTRRPKTGILKLAGVGTLSCVAGLAAVSIARWVHNPHQQRPWSLAIALLLSGFSLLVHFGLFSILAATWRNAGYDARALFRNPFASRSLSDFWSRRWNLAYSEMISLSIYRPVTKRWGTTAGQWLSFLFSGFLHELAISVPVMEGFGLPTLYFLLQAAIMQVEPRYGQTHPAIARTIAVATILLPLPILFHPPFLQQVVAPLL